MYMEDGFTLIELLVVIAIIALLMSIAKRSLRLRRLCVCPIFISGR